MADPQAETRDAISAFFDDLTDVGDMEADYRRDRPLLATDPCDRCGAKARVRVTLKNSKELQFCAHHFGKRVRKALEALGAYLHDEREAVAKEARRPEA